MAKKKLKRRKPKPQREPEVQKDSDQWVSKGKAVRLHHENEKRFPASASIASPKDFTKITGRLTKTKRVSRGG